MEHELYSIVGVREDFWDITQNLRQLVLKGVPEAATFENPIIGKIRAKGPLVVVGGHIVFEGYKNLNSQPKQQHPNAPTTSQPSSSVQTQTQTANQLNAQNTSQLSEKSPKTDQLLMGDNRNTPLDKSSSSSSTFIMSCSSSPSASSCSASAASCPPISILNPNNYICTLSAGAYLALDVLVENFKDVVFPEHGYTSLNRDRSSDGFLYFANTVEPMPVFHFAGERRGGGLDSLGEIVTVEVQTDGTVTPRNAILRCNDELLHTVGNIHLALKNNRTVGQDGNYQELYKDKDVVLDPHRFKNVPWNPWRPPSERHKSSVEFFATAPNAYRQHPIAPGSPEAQAEQRQDFEDDVRTEEMIQEVEKDKGKGDGRGMLPWQVDGSKRDTDPEDWVITNPFQKPDLGLVTSFDQDT
eukprot:GHVT01079029.1.p1 GENE.GHVT01079029.1~~GHVT01079029.1.p1  ORF type:complete len:412 (-),score=81.38 GHVT01079029.1:357-1592(-)